MARRKKSTRKRSRRKKSRVSGLGSTRKFGGKIYRKKSCHSRKTAAKAKAKRMRSKGKNARVIKNPKGGYCIFAR